MIHKHTKFIFFPTFSIYLLQLIQCYPSRFHVSSIPLFHLKQVQYVTILENLKSPTGGAGKEGWVNGVKLKDRFEGGKQGVSDVSLPPPPKPTRSHIHVRRFLIFFIFHTLCEIIFSCIRCFLLSFYCRVFFFFFLSTRHHLHRLLGLHPLAKRRTYWLS